MTTLTMKDEKRIEVIQRVFRGELTVGEAAMILGVSERQCYRIKVRIKEQGAQGVVHGNRGRACQRKVKNKTVQRIVELAQGKYHGFNDHHLTEKLKEHEKISYGVSAYSDEATINRAGGNLVLATGGAQRQPTRFYLLHNLLLERSFKLPPLLSHRSALSRGSILPAG
jgi:transposase